MSVIKVETDELLSCARKYALLAENFKTVSDKTIEKCKSYEDVWKGSFSEELDSKVKKLEDVKNKIYNNCMDLSKHIENAVAQYIAVDQGLAEQSHIGTANYPDNVHVSSTIGLTSHQFELLEKELEKYKNSPYVRGGSSVNGVDCSGLVMAAYRDTGIKTDFPHSAKNIYTMCEPVGKYPKGGVNLSELQKGDLVFYSDDGPEGITHVGVYMGDGKVFSAHDPEHGVSAESINYTYKKNIYVARVKK